MKPTLLINEDVYDEIMFYVNRSKYEVSGMGKVVAEPGGILRVVSQIMLPQKNRYTHTQVEPDDINKMLFELGESPRFWWHSHVQMGVFWSSEDMDTIKVNAGPNGWFINTVFNQKNEIKTAYYSAQGLVGPWGNNPVWYDECETKIGKLPDPRELEWEEIYNQNVTNLNSTWAKNYGGNSAYAKAGEYQTGSTANGTTGASGTAATSLDFSQEPPIRRPQGMTKTLYRAWKAAYRRCQKQLKNGQADTDDYGFTAKERRIIFQNGMTMKDIDELVEEDFTPKEILEIAESDTTITEIFQYLANGFKAPDIMRVVAFDKKTPTHSDDAPVSTEHEQGVLVS